MSIMKSVLVVGSRGMLAGAILRQLADRRIDARGVDLPECDITDEASVDRAFDRATPSLVINCAAYTAVDKCEVEPAACEAVNGRGVGILAEAATRRGAMMVHFSTDFVFDGASHRPYRVDDPPAPVSAYGRSKLAGERALQSSGLKRWLLIRTAWLYGTGGANFPRTMVQAAKEGKPLRVVSDQVGAPTYTEDLASATIDLASESCSGIFHATNRGQTTWWEFAVAALKAFGVDHSVEPITSQAWAQLRPQAARRPSYSVLDLTPLEQSLARPMRPWPEALADFRAAVLRGGW